MIPDVLDGEKDRNNMHVCGIMWYNFTHNSVQRGLGCGFCIVTIIMHSQVSQYRAHALVFPYLKENCKPLDVCAFAVINPGKLALANKDRRTKKTETYKLYWGEVRLFPNKALLHRHACLSKRALCPDDWCFRSIIARDHRAHLFMRVSHPRVLK